MKDGIRELLQRSCAETGIDISAGKMEKFLVFASELKKWNRKFNLISITDDRGIALKHFADSLLLLKVMRNCANLLDVGSGGGFPSIPVKIMSPQIAVVSVDAVEKKILFQRHMARVLGFSGFTAIHSRCEDLPDKYNGYFDMVVSRAFSDIVSFAQLASPFLEKHGQIVAMKGKGGAVEISDSEMRLSSIGFNLSEIVDIRLPVSGESRSLIVLGKIDRKNARQ
jgi:16S rRNA (guanine527-N7)-methyltransferase